MSKKTAHRIQSNLKKEVKTHLGQALALRGEGRLSREPPSQALRTAGVRQETHRAADTLRAGTGRTDSDPKGHGIRWLLGITPGFLHFKPSRHDTLQPFRIASGLGTNTRPGRLRSWGSVHTRGHESSSTSHPGGGRRFRQLPLL